MLGTNINSFKAKFTHSFFLAKSFTIAYQFWALRNGLGYKKWVTQNFLFEIDWYRILNGIIRNLWMGPIS